MTGTPLHLSGLICQVFILSDPIKNVRFGPDLIICCYRLSHCTDGQKYPGFIGFLRNRQ